MPVDQRKRKNGGIQGPMMSFDVRECGEHTRCWYVIVRRGERAEHVLSNLHTETQAWNDTIMYLNGCRRVISEPL